MMATAPASAESRTLPAAARASFQDFVAGELEDVEVNLRAVCEPGCGSVVMKPSPMSAAAEVESLGTGMSLMTYNVDFMAKMHATYGPSVIYAILAHEYGHHVDDLPYGSPWTRELRADAFAGCALARRGDPIGPTMRWVRREHFEEIVREVFKGSSAATTLADSDTHPPWIHRMTALSRGVELCKDIEHPIGLRQFFGNVPAAERLAVDRSRQVAGTPTWSLEGVRSRDPLGVESVAPAHSSWLLHDVRNALSVTRTPSW